MPPADVSPTITRREAGSSPLLKAFAIACVALGVGYSITHWLESRQVAAFQGRLNAHETTVRAPAASRLESLIVPAGTVVEAGRPLAVLIDDGREQRCERARQQLTALEQELAQTVAKAEVNLAWRMRTIESERHEARLRQASFLKEKFDSELQVQAIDDQAPPGAVSLFDPKEGRVQAAGFQDQLTAGLSQDARLRREAAVNAAEVASAQVALCDRRLEQLDKLANKLPAQIRKASAIDSIEERLARAKQELERIENQPATIPLVSSDHGTVGKWRRRIGESIEPDEPLVTVFDEDRRFLIAHVPAESAAKFKEGAEIALLFPGGEKRKGVVAPPPRPSRATSDGEPRAASNRSPAEFDIRIDPTGKRWPQSPIGSAVKILIAR